MFNAMTTTDVLMSVGRVLREAAAPEGTQDEYQRSQLLSAYSVTRHLAAEEQVASELLSWFREQLAAQLDGDPRLAEVRAAGDTAAMGRLVGDLLVELRADPAHADRRRRLCALLGELADREVAALAAPPRPAS